MEETLFYYASVNKVFAVRVERFNDKSIWVVGGGRRARIGYISYYPTFEEAKLEGLKYAQKAY